MAKITMAHSPEIEEVEVNIEDIKLEDKKFYVHKEEHFMLSSSHHLLELYYLGAKAALEGNISKEQAEAFLQRLKIK